MRFIDSVSVKFRMLASFSIIAVLLVIFGLYSLKEMKVLGNLTETLYDHPLQVSNAALAAQSGVIRMHRSMKDVTLAENDFEMGEAIRHVNEEEKAVYRQLDIIQKNILGKEGKLLAQETRRLFNNWKPIRFEVLSLTRNGNRTEAAKVTKGRGAEHVRILEEQMDALQIYARNKADEFMGNAESTRAGITRDTLLIMGGLCTLMLLVAYWMTTHLSNRLGTLQSTISGISETGELKEVEVVGSDEISRLARGFNELVQSLRRQFWLREGGNELSDTVSSSESVTGLAQASLAFVCRHADAASGGIFVHDHKSGVNEMVASYALVERGHLANRFEDGEGIVGQVARERKAIVLTNVTAEDGLMMSGTTRSVPVSIMAVPLVFMDTLLGVMEISTVKPVDPIMLEFMERAAEIVANAMNAGYQRERIDKLYAEATQANTDLVKKGEDLNTANEELAVRNEELQAQSQELKAQTLELQNQAARLQQQKAELDSRRIQVEEADRLKSEFLSNMSHELRTPLNSILALSQLMLSKGTGQNVERESEYLEVIERNGRHLLSLINDILDLSKIESGRMDLFNTEFKPADLVTEIVETISPLTDKKPVSLSIFSQYEEAMVGDRDKVRQIVLNLVSNAVKFTTEGEVSIALEKSGTNVSFTVKDSGIGIAKDDLKSIFDEFRQVDGSTTRRHEGTGLGLAICKKLSNLLGGSLEVESTLGIGSTFVLTIPLTANGDSAGASVPLPTSMPRLKAGSKASSRTVLVVDDEYQSRELIADHLAKAGYNVIEAGSGKEALEIAKTTELFAITLDIVMPEMDGWETIRQLKQASGTADIPVIIVSVSDDRATGMALGASGYVVKPVDKAMLLGEMDRIRKTREVNTVLVVDDDDVARQQIRRTLVTEGYSVIEAEGGEAGIKQAMTLYPDAMILDLMMPDMDGFQVLDAIKEEPNLSNMPVLIVTAKDLSASDRTLLTRNSEALIQKGALDLDQILQELDRNLQILTAREAEKTTRNGSTALVVEDNKIAALQISTVMEDIGCRVLHAVDGGEALQLVEKTIPDLIILDLMMPGIDGFEVLESIRSKPETEQIPVVVLTAKELTSEDKARLSNNNISQLVRKGSLDREQLKALALAAMDQGTKGSDAGSDEPTPAPVATHDENEPLRGSGSTLLVVEDNQDNQLTLRAVLDDYEGKLVIAEDGESGLRTAREIQPDLILMDIQLPGMSGLEATEKIRQDDQLSAIPIIALTARAMKGDRDEIFAAGCNELIVKPYDTSALRHAVRTYLQPLERS